MIVTYWLFAMFQFEELCGRKIQESDDNTDDSEWEEAENLKFVIKRRYTSLFVKDKDFLYNEISLFSWMLPFAKVFSRENEDNFRLAKVFSAKFVPEIVIRESFCQKISRFFASRKFLPAKVTACESYCPRKFLPAKVSARESIYYSYYVL